MLRDGAAGAAAEVQHARPCYEPADEAVVPALVVPDAAPDAALTITIPRERVPLVMPDDPVSEVIRHNGKVDDPSQVCNGSEAGMSNEQLPAQAREQQTAGGRS